MELLLQGLALFFFGFLVYLGCQLYVIVFEVVTGLIFMVIGGLFDLVVAARKQWLRKDDKDEPPPYNYS